MTVAAYWMLSDNFGDKLTPWLIEKIRGEKPAWVPPAFDAEHYMVCGSILNHANKHAMVWGTGLADLSDVVNCEARIFAVRGPLSRARALSCGAVCPPVYGDPALLLPRFHSAPVQKKHAVGLVPHYTDFYRVSSREEYKGLKIVNVFDSVENFADGIRACELVVSSSLHGIIVAHAYGIPAAWAAWGDSIGGDRGTKFRDYFMSQDLDIAEPVDRRVSYADVSAESFTLPKKGWGVDLNALWGACPIRRSGE